MLEMIRYKFNLETQFTIKMIFLMYVNMVEKKAMCKFLSFFPFVIFCYLPGFQQEK